MKKKESILFGDFETWGPVDITTEGADKYARKAGVLLFSYRFSHWPAGQVKFIENFDRRKLTVKDFPAEITKFRGLFVAHNWSFEHAIFSHCLPYLKHFADPTNYICTAATARRMGLPGSLFDAAKALNLPNQKEKAEGSRLIRLYSIPDKAGKFRPIPDSDRATWRHYGGADVLAMESIFNTLPRLDQDAFEGPVFRLDQKINLRGLRIDTGAVKKIRTAYGAIVAKAEKDARKLCGVEASGTLTATSAAGFKRWLGEHGARVDNVQAATLADVLRKTKSDKVKKAIGFREILAAAGPKKLDSMLTFAGLDERVRHAFFYFGGHTGRWSGRGPQFQNYVRAASKDWQKTFADVVAGRGTVADVNALLRGCIVPGKGRRFAVGDFSAIEARGLFYLAGDKLGLATFAAGRDIYKEQAARFYGVAAGSVNATQRQIGKAQILGLGYGMGKDRFTDYAATYGVTLTAEQAAHAVALYRETFRAVPQFWRDCEQAFKVAVHTGSATQGDGPRRIVWKLSADKRFLRVALPSGRPLYYFRPRLSASGEMTVALPRGGIQTLWGGVIVENLVQAFSRDLLAASMVTADRAGLDICGTVHDEIICETPTKNAKADLKKLEKAMSVAPAWAERFPLAAECKILERYGK
ncbi:MAG: hypothetical protein IPJ01_12220 [Micavibrio sp.]|nr:hypothetical protein [Micavibrio sp.]